MHQTVVSALATRGRHAVDSGLQGGGLSSLQQQHAFGRLEGCVDPSDHLESLYRVKIDPSPMTELQIPPMKCCCWGSRIRMQSCDCRLRGPFLSVSLSAWRDRGGPAGTPCQVESQGGQAQYRTWAAKGASLMPR